MVAFKETLFAIDEVLNGFNKINQASKNMAKSNKIADKQISDSVKGLNKGFDNLKNSIIDATGTGPILDMGEHFKSFRTLVNNGAISMGRAFTALKATMIEFILPITLIVGAFLTLKRMFELNVGGMQTKWAQFTGRIMQLWGKFRVAFDKALLAMGPLFSVVFGMIEETITPILDGLMYLVDVFNMMPGPLKAITVAVAGLTIAMIAFNTATGGILIAVGLIGVALWATVKAIKTMYQRFQELQQTNPTLAKIVKVLFFLAFPILLVIKYVKQLFSWFKKTNETSDRMAKFGNIIKIAFLLPFRLLIGYFKVMHQAQVKFWTALTKIPIIGKILVGLKNAFTGFFNMIWAGFTALPKLVVDIFNGIIDTIIGAFDSLVNVLPDWAKGILGIEEIKPVTIESAPGATAGNTNTNNSTNNNQTYNTTINTTQSPEKVMVGLDSILAKDLSN